MLCCSFCVLSHWKLSNQHMPPRHKNEFNGTRLRCELRTATPFNRFNERAKRIVNPLHATNKPAVAPHLEPLEREAGILPASKTIGERCKVDSIIVRLDRDRPKLGTQDIGS